MYTWEKSFVSASRPTERHKVTARAHFLLRGLLSESNFLSSELSFLFPRLDGPWLFSVDSAGFLVLWSAAADLGFRPAKAQDRTDLTRKIPAKVAKRVESTSDPDRPFTWPRRRPRAWATGVSELGWTGNFSCRGTHIYQICSEQKYTKD